MRPFLADRENLQDIETCSNEQRPGVLRVTFFSGVGPRSRAEALGTCGNASVPMSLAVPEPPTGHCPEEEGRAWAGAARSGAKRHSLTPRGPLLRYLP